MTVVEATMIFVVALSLAGAVWLLAGIGLDAHRERRAR